MSGFSNREIFDFYIDKGENRGDGKKSFDFGGYTVYTDCRTSVITAEKQDREIIIFGLCADLCEGKEAQPEKILKNTDSLLSVIEYERYLGGKYIIFYREGEECYAIPDATASVPLCYSTSGNGFVCSSSSEVIAKTLNLNVDKKMQKIRNSSDISQAMPYDLTVWREIKQLLPNHYIQFSKQKAVRFLNSVQKQLPITADEAAEKTEPYINRLAQFYASKFKMFCPITGGRDSRVVLAFLRKAVENSELQCYTIKHKEHSGNEDDLVIPQVLSEAIGFSYKQISDSEPTDELVEMMDFWLGKGRYSKRTLTIANTVYGECGEGAIVNGDIIGQVGKCSLHRDIPEFLATAGYFRCKLHNYSRESKKSLKCWLDEIKKSNEKVNAFDLFSVENRMGRWAAQENLIYNAVGQLYLNIFNSRSIIYEWTRVPRTQRKNSAVHLALLNKVDPQLASYSFEKDKSAFISLSKSNGLFYYASSYLKYFAQKLLFHIKNH